MSRPATSSQSLSPPDSLEVWWQGKTLAPHAALGAVPLPAPGQGQSHSPTPHGLTGRISRAELPA